MDISIGVDRIQSKQDLLDDVGNVFEKVPILRHHVLFNRSQRAEIED